MKADENRFFRMKAVKPWVINWFFPAGQVSIGKNSRSITSIQAVYAPADDLTDLAPATTNICTPRCYYCAAFEKISRRISMRPIHSSS